MFSVRCWWRGVTVSFRIPGELKRRMDELGGRVDWGEEVRRFLERRVEELEQAKAVEDLEKVIASLPPGA
ncbi:type II toxin-antitoxin system VapB family antitoxin [Thermofilum pendens]|uniref:CopG family transcriptional regulator n=1 Tax=Thermofilum pendens (strain DSM 2475 / Hrk 5) TaxID=368408 RepID=A1RZV4_THEPD|nr:hypothetical protein [Thermofilum pendens]ABL78734.1 conserved hypothetical protein [Thermofilum pendens Hrk 5]